MSTKRKYDQANEQPAVHESRVSQVPGSIPPASKKPRRIEPSTNVHASSVNGIKKRIRDATRRLKAPNLPSDVRVQDERALALYEKQLEVAQAEKIKQKMITKYHMVRFFERQKATKQLKKLKKRLITTESLDEVEEIKRLMHISEVDLNYAQYCPLAEKYVSLFPPKESDTEEPAERPKPPMWAEIERRMEEGTLDELRNRVSVSKVKVKGPPPRSKKVQAAPEAKVKFSEPVIVEGNRRQRRKAEGKSRAKEEKPKRGAKSYDIQMAQPVQQEADGGGDGGFFDE